MLSQPSIHLLPNVRFPKKKGNRQLGCLKVLKEAIKNFDKELLMRGADHACKTAKVKVDGYQNERAPRESVYNSELMRGLSKWLSQQRYMVTGQWHHVIGENHKYSTVHCSRWWEIQVCVRASVYWGAGIHQGAHWETKQYRDNLRAVEAWVVHFTREDDYLARPQWQSDELLSDDINVVHISRHNYGFTDVRMRARLRVVE